MLDCFGAEPGLPPALPSLPGAMLTDLTSGYWYLLTMALPAVKAWASWFVRPQAVEYEPAAVRVRTPRWPEATEPEDRREEAPDRWLA